MLLGVLIYAFQLGKNLYCKLQDQSLISLLFIKYSKRFLKQLSNYGPKLIINIINPFPPTTYPISLLLLRFDFIRSRTYSILFYSILN